MEFDQIKELMKELESSKLIKLVYKKGDAELHLEKETVPLRAAPKAVAVESVHEPAFHTEPAVAGERGSKKPTEPVAGSFVTSPMVGTFYSSPAPDQPAFVKVGDKVSIDTVVCIIEAMKVMNEVKAGVAGQVAEIIADSSQPVEFGSRLIRIV
jgi:acetyl-CoA carboxylase biotin carboxyl carrier protein